MAYLLWTRWLKYNPNPIGSIATASYSRQVMARRFSIVSCI